LSSPEYLQSCPEFPLPAESCLKTKNPLPGGNGFMIAE
jgi:hypothetical protein